MSERFTRFFALPEALYAEGSPLLIEAGALLRDSQNGRLIAQLKLKNLGEKAVQAAKIRLWTVSALGDAAPEPVEYTYLDLKAAHGTAFGSQKPIPIPDPTTRSFRAEILQAAFADGSRWTAPEGAVWAPLPAGETLETALGDPELCKQLRLERGEDCRFRPARMLDLWRCACGEAVRGETCPACGKGFFEIDRAALTVAKDDRLAAEKEAAEKAAAEAAEQAAALAKLKAERAEKAKARRKKTGKIAALAAAALVVAAAILLGIPGLSAIQAGKAAGAGDYIGAMEKYRSAAGWGLFNTLFHPDEKADALIPASHYQEGEEALAEGRYEDALAAFKAAGNYADAAERRAGSLSGAVEAYAEAGELEKAVALLAEVPAADEQARLALLLAGKAAEQGEYRRAYELFLQAGQKPEDEELWAACCAAAVREYAAEGDMEAAEAARKAFPGQGRNSEANELNLVLSEGYIQVRNFEKANAFLYRIVTAFQDADLEARRQEARYQIGLGFYGQGAYAEAQRNLEGNYKDSEHYYALCLVGEAIEKAKKGDYDGAVSAASKVDESKLTNQEKDDYRTKLYDMAKGAEGSGKWDENYYIAAFTLYELSGKADYQERMQACNQAYIQSPRQLLRWDSSYSPSMYYFDDNYLPRGSEIQNVEYTCQNGILSIYVTYKAKTNLSVSFNGEHEYPNYSETRFASSSAPAGEKTVVLTVQYSQLTDTAYDAFVITLQRNASEYHTWHVAPKVIQAASLDLYGNPIP